MFDVPATMGGRMSVALTASHLFCSAPMTAPSEPRETNVARPTLHPDAAIFITTVPSSPSSTTTTEPYSTSSSTTFEYDGCDYSHYDIEPSPTIPDCAHMSTDQLVCLLESKCRNVQFVNDDGCDLGSLPSVDPENNDTPKDVLTSAAELYRVAVESEGVESVDPFVGYEHEEAQTVI